jgi:RNA polymerase sigma-70 factor (ECF subfamily)
MGVKPSAGGAAAPRAQHALVDMFDEVSGVGPSTVDLLERARQGDPCATDALFQRIVPALRRWARGRLPANARELCDTEDLVQDTLAGVLRHLTEFEVRHQGSLLAYLRLALLNRVRDEVRRTRRRAPAVELPAEWPDGSASPLEQVLGRAEVMRYERALQRLRAEHREAILWRIECGCGYEELANALGKPSANAARVAVRRALMRLAKEMSDEA